MHVAPPVDDLEKPPPGKPKKSRTVAKLLAGYLRAAEVFELLGISKSTFFREIKGGTFPEGVQLSKQGVGWKKSTIEEWAASNDRQAIKLR